MQKKNLPAKKQLHTQEDIQENDIELSKKMNNDPFTKVMRELMSLRKYPRMQIFIAHGFLELLVSTIIKRKAKNGGKITKDSKIYTYAVLLTILNEMGEMSNEEYQIFEWFRKLRNKAAHEPLFSVTESDLSHFPPQYRDINNFSRLCTDLISLLWNANTEILLPIFLPSLLPRYEMDKRNNK